MAATQQESKSTSNVVIDPSELEQLNRLLDGRLTEAEAKEYAAGQLVKHDEILHSIETKLTEVRALLDTPFMSRTDVRNVQRKIERLELDLSEAHRLRERSIRLNGAGIKAAKEADELRPRWEFLKKREQAINNATLRLRKI